MQGLTAHIIEVAPIPPRNLTVAVFALATAAFVVWLAVQHHVVKHGRLNWSSIRRGIGASLALSTAALLAPSSATGQAPAIPTGLPDLVSEPAHIWFEKTVTYDDGSIARVLAFDGYLHNIGPGVLDLLGDPQQPDGMRQRFHDGNEWVDIGTPLVRFETSDDHNHFHLMAAAEYELWNEARTTKIGDSAKVGFCLLDTEQLDDSYDAFYDIGEFAYCQQDNPTASELRMGISPGWVDTYDANTTLQWVDISDIRPGRYWVASIMDPNDEIVENDEDNNGLVFSTNVWPVPGWVARHLPTQQAGQPILLKAHAYGRVGPVAYRIVEPPSNGSLSVPTGVDLVDPVIHYVPNDGFVGVDSFRYEAFDAASSYPRTPPSVVVEIATAAGVSEQGSEAPGVALELLDPPEHIDVSRFENFSTTLQANTPTALWYSTGLPPGLSIDRASGEISGIASEDGEGIAHILATADGPNTSPISIEIRWSVSSPPVADRTALDEVADFSTLQDEVLNLYIGPGTPDAEYSATNLPEGMRMVENIPLLAGTPSEVGDFEIEVIEMVDGQETNRSAFVWTVRPRPIPAFPL